MPFWRAPHILPLIDPFLQLTVRGDSSGGHCPGEFYTMSGTEVGTWKPEQFCETFLYLVHRLLGHLPFLWP